MANIWWFVAISDDDSSDVDAHLPVASWREDVADEECGTGAASPPASARPKRTTAPKMEEPKVDDDEDEVGDEDDEDLEDDVYVVGRRVGSLRKWC